MAVSKKSIYPFVLSWFVARHFVIVTWVFVVRFSRNLIAGGHPQSCLVAFDAWCPKPIAATTERSPNPFPCPEFLPIYATKPALAHFLKLRVIRPYDSTY